MIQKHTSSLRIAAASWRWGFWLKTNDGSDSTWPWKCLEKTINSWIPQGSNDLYLLMANFCWCQDQKCRNRSGTKNCFHFCNAVLQINVFFWQWQILVFTDAYPFPRHLISCRLKCMVAVSWWLSSWWLSSCLAWCLVVVSSFSGDVAQYHHGPYLIVIISVKNSFQLHRKHSWAIIIGSTCTSGEDPFTVIFKISNRRQMVVNPVKILWTIFL